ncbi:MAG: T-complex protein 1 subunit eta [Cercozoa sp. M6MM]
MQGQAGMLRPTILLLKEGTDTSQGVGQIVSNINACQAVAKILSTTLGPRGMDKLIHSSQSKATISNDGATIIKLLDIVHPAAKTLTDIAQSQDDEVGDGTTSVVLLAAEMLKYAKSFIEEGQHPQTVIRGYQFACKEALRKVRELAIPIDATRTREMLERCAATAMNSKLVAGHQSLFAPLVVDAVLSLDQETLDLSMIGVKKIPGGSLKDSFLVNGVAFQKAFSYAGFEQMPKRFNDPKVLVLNVELELKKEREDAEVRLSDPRQYQAVVDAEWKLLFDKLEAIAASGAQVVLSRLPIGDLATQFFADRGIFCAGRVPAADLWRTSAATGAVMQTSLADLSEDILGTCELFEERQFGSERYNVFTGCAAAKTSTIVLRGGAEQFIAETERSLHDAIMIVKRAVQYSEVVGGGGAIEMELSKHLKDLARGIADKTQLIVKAYARAFEVIPRQLAENAGFDCTDLVNQLRADHAKGKTWHGIDIDAESTCDMIDKHVWEPARVRLNAIAAATEAACVVLSVDETVRGPKANNPSDGPVQQQAPQQKAPSIR